ARDRAGSCARCRGLLLDAGGRKRSSLSPRSAGTVHGSRRRALGAGDLLGGGGLPRLVHPARPWRGRGRGERRKHGPAILVQASRRRHRAHLRKARHVPRRNALCRRRSSADARGGSYGPGLPCGTRRSARRGACLDQSAVKVAIVLAILGAAVVYAVLKWV